MRQSVEAGRTQQGQSTVHGVVLQFGRRMKEFSDYGALAQPRSLPPFDLFFHLDVLNTSMFPPSINYSRAAAALFVPSWPLLMDFILGRTTRMAMTPTFPAPVSLLLSLTLQTSGYLA
jgi:hypothetical protein